MVNFLIYIHTLTQPQMKELSEFLKRLNGGAGVQPGSESDSFKALLGFDSVFLCLEFQLVFAFLFLRV